MAQTILFQARGGINEKSTVAITLFDKIDNDRPFTMQVVTCSYDKKLKEYLISDISTDYYYDYAEALEKYINTLQHKIAFGYFIRHFQNKPVTINL